jgi:hypothetical protein
MTIPPQASGGCHLQTTRRDRHAGGGWWQEHAGKAAGGATAPPAVIGSDYPLTAVIGHVHSGLVDELPWHPGLPRFSITATSRLSETGTFSFIVSPLPRQIMRRPPSNAREVVAEARNRPRIRLRLDGVKRAAEASHVNRGSAYIPFALPGDWQLGGRPIVALASELDPDANTCPWCKGSRRCAKCEGTGQRVAKTRILHRTLSADCRACEGSGVCQLCKQLDSAP